MNTTNFSDIAARYERDSLIQRSAADRLLGLLDIKNDDHVIDLGCGTGKLARTLRTMTEGAVVGIDASEGMIREAEQERKGMDITFETKSAEELDHQNRFTVIFCNSAFQWFSDPAKALRNCHAALVRGGRMGIQAPAKKRYCPNFQTALDAVARDTRTERIFSGFRPPWTFLDSVEEYRALFQQAGFSVPFAVIEEIRTLHAPDEVMKIFESGAAAGYLNQEYYAASVDAAYTRSFREIVMTSFQRQADSAGQVELIFNRIYLLAVKESQA
jgi:trans-aconitate methyltransferase